jgi:hypothetical protein
MKSKDIETIFSILGTGVTAVTYLKDGYTIAIVPPVKKAAVPNPINEELKKVIDSGEPGINNASGLRYINTVISKYKHNSNYELYVKDNKLWVRQHDLGGCTHTILVTNLTEWEAGCCKTAGILVK